MYIQLSAITSDPKVLLLITSVDLHFHFENNTTLSKLEGYEKYAVESRGQKEVSNYPTALHTVLPIHHSSSIHIYSHT